MGVQGCDVVVQRERAMRDRVPDLACARRSGGARLARGVYTRSAVVSTP